MKFIVTMTENEKNAIKTLRTIQGVTTTTTNPNRYRVDQVNWSTTEDDSIVLEIDDIIVVPAINLIARWAKPIEMLLKSIYTMGHDIIEDWKESVESRWTWHRRDHDITLSRMDEDQDILLYINMGDNKSHVLRKHDIRNWTHDTFKRYEKYILSSTNVGYRSLVGDIDITEDKDRGIIYIRVIEGHLKDGKYAK